MIERGHELPLTKRFTAAEEYETSYGIGVLKLAGAMWQH